MRILLICIFTLLELQNIYDSLALSLSVVFLETLKVEMCFAEVQHHGVLITAQSIFLSSFFVLEWNMPFSFYSFPDEDWPQRISHFYFPHTYMFVSLTIVVSSVSVKDSRKFLQFHLHALLLSAVNFAEQCNRILRSSCSCRYSHCPSFQIVPPSSLSLLL